MMVALISVVVQATLALSTDECTNTERSSPWNQAAASSTAVLTETTTSMKRVCGRRLWTDWPTYWLTHWLTGRCTKYRCACGSYDLHYEGMGWVRTVDWLVVPMATIPLPLSRRGVEEDWLTDWLIDWLTGLLGYRQLPHPLKFSKNVWGN